MLQLKILNYIGLQKPSISMKTRQKYALSRLKINTFRSSHVRVFEEGLEKKNKVSGSKLQDNLKQIIKRKSLGLQIVEK